MTLNLNLKRGHDRFNESLSISVPPQQRFVMMIYWGVKISLWPFLPPSIRSIKRKSNLTVERLRFCSLIHTTWYIVLHYIIILNINSVLNVIEVVLAFQKCTLVYTLIFLNYLERNILKKIMFTVVNIKTLHSINISRQLIPKIHEKYLSSGNSAFFKVTKKI